MMKKLYLIRHAKSSWSDPNADDFDRKLNKRGKRDAPFMGKILYEKGILPDFIASSPSKRTKQTVELILAENTSLKSKIDWNKSIYEASHIELLSIVNSFSEDYHSVLLVAHNPGLTTFSNYLTDHFIDNIPTCGIVGIGINSKWFEVKAGSGKFLFFEYPKKYFLQ